MRELLHRPAVRVLLAVGVVAVIAGVWWFQPHKLFIDATVDEDFPEMAATTAPPASQMEDAGVGTGPAVDESGTAPAEPRLLTSGAFRSLGRYETTGTAGIYELADGSRVLRLEDFATTNGPDLLVWLSAAPADAEGREYAEDYLDLGPLKGNVGNQNYEIPAGVDLRDYRSVVIWCRRFTVGFGSAELSGAQ